MGRALTTNLFTLYLEISRDKSVLHATPLPANKQNTTPAKSNMGHTHLSSLEQSCQGATVLVRKIKQGLSPAAIWIFKKQAPYLFLTCHLIE
jgi:hypothetical protein